MLSTSLTLGAAVIYKLSCRAVRKMAWRFAGLSV